MKRVVLCEGRRDVEMLEHFFDANGPDVAVGTFYGEEVTYDRLRNQESEAIRDFLSPRHPCDVLAKSENGKPDLVRVFSKLVRSLVERPVDTTLLVDLDGDSLDALFVDLDERVRDVYSGTEFRIREAERGRRSPGLLAANGSLYSVPDDRRRGEFSIVAFRDSLEAATGIERTDGPDLQRRKLETFVTDTRATQPLRSVLL